MVIVWLGLDHTHTITDPEWNEFLKQVGRSIERGDP